MSPYRKCEICGAHLDHGERCDCTNRGEEPQAGHIPTVEAANEAALQEALAADVTITLRKEPGSNSFNRKIEASSASAALNGIAVLIREYAKLTNLPVVRVLALLAATMTAPALKEQ